MLLNSPTEAYASRLCVFFRPEERVIILFVMCAVTGGTHLRQAGMLRFLGCYSFA